MLQEAGEGEGAAAGEEKVQGVAGILPGLPDDVALRCLAFVPRSHHHSLRQVCSRWRNLVSKGLTSFHALRRSLGLTSDYLVLVASDNILSHLTFSELHLSSPTPSHRTVLFGTTPPTALRHRNDRDEYDDDSDEYDYCPHHRHRSLQFWRPAHIPLGPFVLVLGGRLPSLWKDEPDPLDGLHIFDISSGSWRRGASMISPRYAFAWGVIENRLYVAGGISEEVPFGGAPIAITKGAEVYDFEADKWSPIASLPALICIEFSYVYNDALYVGGYTLRFEGFVPELFSYWPSLDQWQQEERHPETFYSPDSPTQYPKQMMSIQDHEATSLYLLDISGRVMSNFFYKDLKVLKLDQETSKWNVVYQGEDEREDCCCCSEDVTSPSFVSIGKMPVVMTHLDDAHEEYDASVHTLTTQGPVHILTTQGPVELRVLNNVVRLSVECPQLWCLAVINA